MERVKGEKAIFSPPLLMTFRALHSTRQLSLPVWGCRNTIAAFIHTISTPHCLSCISDKLKSLENIHFVDTDFKRHCLELTRDSTKVSNNIVKRTMKIPWYILMKAFDFNKAVDTKPAFSHIHPCAKEPHCGPVFILDSPAILFRLVHPESEGLRLRIACLVWAGEGLIS